MTDFEHAVLAYYQTRRERKEPVNDNDLDEFERKYRESMEVIRECMERKS
jgi:hypothetical protein